MQFARFSYAECRRSQTTHCTGMGSLRAGARRDRQREKERKSHSHTKCVHVYLSCNYFSLFSFSWARRNTSTLRSQNFFQRFLFFHLSPRRLHSKSNYTRRYNVSYKYSYRTLLTIALLGALLPPLRWTLCARQLDCALRACSCTYLPACLPICARAAT